MSLSTFALVLTAVLLNAAAQLLLKAGTRVLGVLSLDTAGLPALAVSVAMQPHILGGLVCFVLSVGLWIVALSRVDVSIAYPMNGIGYVVNALMAWHLFGEPLSAGRVLGITIILVGVVVLARS